MDFNLAGVKDVVRDAINNPMAPGVVGAFLGLKSAVGKGWGTIFYNFCMAIALVKYGAPWLVEVLKINGDSSVALLGFAVGWGGLNVADMLLIVVRDRGPDILAGVLSAWADRVKPTGKE